MAKKHTDPPAARNAYESAQMLWAEMVVRAGEDKRLTADLEELWRLFDLCIPDEAKPRPQ